MARDWSQERYVRLYVTETPDEAAWCWQARAIWPLLIKAADRAGVIETTKGVRGIAARIRMPVEVVELGLPELVEDTCLEPTARGYLLRNYIEAQTAKMTSNQRTAEFRARERAKSAKDGGESDDSGNAASRGVTRGNAESVGGNAMSTPSRAELSRTEQSRAEEVGSVPASPAVPPPLELVPSEPVAPKPDPVADLWAEQERLRAETVPGCRGLTLTADRRKRIASLLAAGYSADDLAAAQRGYADEARRGGGEWFNGDTNWRPDNVARQLGRIGTSAKGRDGPGGVTRGQYQPDPTTRHADGDQPL